MNTSANGCAVIPDIDLNYRTRDCQLRLVLCAGEVHRIRRPHAQVRVVFGVAHVSQAGRDIIVSAGDCTMIDDKADVALLSALGKQPLIVELYS